MDVKINFSNLEHSDAIREYAETKIAKKLKKYVEEPISLQITLSLEKLSHIVKVNLNANGFLIHVEERDNNIYSAIDLVSDILERKLKKYFEKIKDKKNKNNKNNKNKGLMIREEVLSLPEEGEAQSKREVIKVKNYEIKPMDIEEAVMQMDLLNRDFLVFINTETDKVNVIYKRRDNNYGLIEATKK
ncbi:MAG: ribosome-associated translation inhibitor RaiA [Proteobacteria bacterium]|nr:ribosome-associated translation inhibitor RaiA [Pseudomonadota bacterium]